MVCQSFEISCVSIEELAFVLNSVPVISDLEPPDWVVAACFLGAFFQVLELEGRQVIWACLGDRRAQVFPLEFAQASRRTVVNGCCIVAIVVEGVFLWGMQSLSQVCVVSPEALVLFSHCVKLFDD